MTLKTAGVVSSAPGGFDEPTDVAIAANGDIFVIEGHSLGTAAGNIDGGVVRRQDLEQHSLK